MNVISIEKNNTIGFYKAVAIIAIVMPFVILFSLLITELLKDHYYGVSTDPKAMNGTVVAGESLFADVIKPTYMKPVRLVGTTYSGMDAGSNEALNGKILFDLDIVGVGVLEDGSMEAPKNWSEAGWYTKSAKPGDVGNVFINAHYDDNFGRPAAFWSLKNLVEGDKVSVIDEYGLIHTYEVFKVFHVDINDPSRLDIIKGNTSEKTLTLITCGGVWIPGAGTYSQRLVVQANYLN